MRTPTNEMKRVAALACAGVLLACSAGAWEWVGNTRTKIKTAQVARDSKTTEAIEFLVSGFTDDAEEVAIRCIDYVKRMILVEGVPYDLDTLRASATQLLPARTLDLSEKLADLLASIGPGEAGRAKLEEMLLADNVKTSKIALNALIGEGGWRDPFSIFRDKAQHLKKNPAGDNNSLKKIMEAAKKFSNDEPYQVAAIRAIGVLGAEEDVPLLAETLNTRNLNPDGKYQTDRVVYALRAAAKFKAGRDLIDLYIGSPNRKLRKEAQKALEDWARERR